MIIALAGRRVDALDAQPPRFPLENTVQVQERISALLKERKATILVCSGACGADLLALNAAGELGLRRRIVLPFERERFRQTSVTDRPGDWGALFDKVSKEVEAVGDLIVLQNIVEDDAYAITNKAILDEALALTRQDGSQGSNTENPSSSLEARVLAVLVWDGVERGEGDMTAAFAKEARTYGLKIADIHTQ